MGATLIDVDGIPLSGLDPEASDRLLRGQTGAIHALHYAPTTGTMKTVMLPVEDVLPITH